MRLQSKNVTIATFGVCALILAGCEQTSKLEKEKKVEDPLQILYPTQKIKENVNKIKSQDDGRSGQRISTIEKKEYKPTQSAPPVA